MWFVTTTHKLEDMKAPEMKELSNEELMESLTEKQGSLNKLKINHKVAELENPIVIRNIRRSVAQIKTELRSRALQANK